MTRNKMSKENKFLYPTIAARGYLRAINVWKEMKNKKIVESSMTFLLVEGIPGLVWKTQMGK